MPRKNDYRSPLFAELERIAGELEEARAEARQIMFKRDDMVRAMYSQGWSPIAMGRAVGTSRQVIWMIVKDTPLQDGVAEAIHGPAPPKPRVKVTMETQDMIDARERVLKYLADQKEPFTTLDSDPDGD